MTTIVSMYWLGPVSNYDTDDKTLAHLSVGDLGGRYIALPMGKTPAELFDKVMPTIKNVYTQAGRNPQMGVYGVLIDAIRMNWFFTAQEFDRMSVRIDELEDRLKKLEQKKEES